MQKRSLDAAAALAFVLCATPACGEAALLAPPGPERADADAPADGGHGGSSASAGRGGAPASGTTGRGGTNGRGGTAGRGGSAGRGGTGATSGSGGSSGAAGRSGRDAGAGAAGSNGSDGGGGSAASAGAGPAEAGSRGSTALINEVVVDPQRDWNDSGGGNGVAFDGTPGNAAVTGSDEWVELYNASSAAIDLGGWSLSMTDGTPAVEMLGVDDAVLVFSAGGSLAAWSPGEYLVVGNPKGDLSNAISFELHDAAGVLVDRVTLGSEGAAPSGNATGADDEAIARIPDAADTGNDGADFTARPATPGAAN